MTEHRSRREVLRKGSAGLLAVGTVGLAGCGDVIGGGGGGGGPSYASGQVADWLCDVRLDAADRPDDDERSWSFDYHVPDVVFENEEYLSYSFLDASNELRNETGVTAADLDWYLQQNTDASVEIAAGSFEIESIEEGLDDHWDGRVRFIGQYEDNSQTFDLFEYDEREDPRRYQYAVNDEYVLRTTWAGETDDILDQVIDARWGEVGRWTEDPDGERLLEDLEIGQQVSGSVFEPLDPNDVDLDEENEWQYGIVGSTSTADVDGETTDITQQLLFERERDVDPEGFERFVERNRDIDDSYPLLEDYSIDQDGRILTLTGTVRTRAYF